jgi:hypothetical protein
MEILYFIIVGGASYLVFIVIWKLFGFIWRLFKGDKKDEYEQY